jgi:uncharacterized membrane protein YagU involved in acid resistance
MNFLMIGLSGFLGTTAMIAIMSFIHRMKWANADMIRAVGSIVTGSYENSFYVGLIVHYAVGISFSFLYTLIIAVAPIQTPGSTEIIAGLTGVVHGLMVGLLLMVEVAEHHPVERFQRVGLGVAVSHVIGHIVYGLTVGFILAHQWGSTRQFLDAISEDRFNAGDVIGFSLMAIPIFWAPFLFIFYMSYGFIKSKLLADLRDETNKQSQSKSTEKVEYRSQNTPRKDSSQDQTQNQNKNKKVA